MITPPDLAAALDQLAAQAPNARRSWRYYEGRQAEQFLSAKVRAALRETGTTFRYNYCEEVVRSKLDRLELTSLTVQPDALNAVWAELAAAGGWEEVMEDAHELAAVAGEAFVLVWPDEDDTPTWTVHGPDTATAVYHGTIRATSPNYVTLVEDAGDDLRRATVYYQDRLERWEETAKDVWTELADDDTDDADTPGTWTYPDDWPVRCPMFHLRTRRTAHGRPLHENGIPVQRMVDKTVTTHMAVTDYHGAPIRYALLHDNDPSGTSAYDDLDLDDDTVDAESADPADTTSRLRSGPGDLWLMPGVKSVGQFEPAQPSTFLEPLEAQVRGMAVTTATPSLITGHGWQNPPSGAALRRMESAEVNLVGRLQRIFGATWTAVASYTLAVAGHPGAVVSLEWKAAGSYDDGDAWDVAGSKRGLGVPLRQVLLERGYSASDLDRWGITEDDGSGTVTADGIALLAQKLYLAVGPLLSANEARDLLRQAGADLPGELPEPGPGN